MLKQKILPINMRPETRLSFHLSTVLNEDMYPWFYEHFINIKFLGDKEIYMEFVDNIIDNSYRSLFSERICYDMDLIPDGSSLLKVLKRNIDRNFYSYLWLDKYEIPESEEFHKYHFIHPVLVYGYDETEQCFYLINFTWSKGSYLQKVSFETIQAAYLLIKEHIGYHYHMMGEHTVLTSYKIDARIEKRSFSLNHFLIELSNYIYSRADNITEHNPSQYATCEYGLNGYKRLLYVCDHGTEGVSLAFKSLFDLNLHKQYIYERLCYIREKYSISDDISKYIDEYKRVSQIFNTLQMLNMKYQVQEKKNVASFSTNQKFHAIMKNLITEAWEIEKKTLIEIYMQLSLGVEFRYTPMSFTRIEYENDECSSERNIRVTIKPEDSVYVQRIEIMDTSEMKKWRPMGVLRINDKDEYLIEDNVGIGHKDRGIDILPCRITKLEYTECFPSNSNICDLKFHVYTLNESISWDFTKHESYTWVAEKDIKDIRFERGITYVINGNDANISCKSINISAEDGRYIYIKYCNRTNSQVAQIFFNTYTDTILNEVMSKIVTIGRSEESMEYVFDMTDNPAWQGIIKDLRFDPTGYDNTTVDGECMIEYIKINDIAPIYDSRKHFCGSQGVNGWFYYAYDNGTAYREMQFDEEKRGWSYPTCPELFIMKEKQNSYHHMTTVRRYVCQANGHYSVKYNVQLESINKKSYLTIKRNHQIVKRHGLYKYSGEAKLELALEYGENLNFEYYNEEENTIEEIRLNITIEKVDK